MSSSDIKASDSIKSVNKEEYLLKLGWKKLTTLSPWRWRAKDLPYVLYTLDDAYELIKGEK